MRCVACLLGVVVGCGGGAGHPLRDGAVDGPSDTPIDAPVDGVVPPAPCAHMMAPRIITQQRPNAVAVADVDHDGNPDLLVTEVSVLDVMLGHGDGSFAPAIQAPLPGGGPMALAAADFDGDGDLDVAIAGANGVQLMLGDGHGNFTPGAVLAAISPTSVAVGDLDGNGSIDIAAVSAYGAGGVTVFLGTGTGSFAAPVVVDPSNAYDAVAIADMDGDHHLDLVAVGAVPIMIGSVTQLAVYRGNGDGTFAAPFSQFSSVTFARQLAVGDLNGDGVPDIVTAGWIVTDWEVLAVESWLGAGDGTFAPHGGAMLYPDRPTDHLPPDAFDGVFRGVLALGDFDADGKLDTAVTFWNRDVIDVLRGNGTGDVAEIAEYATGRQPTYLSSADVDGDGRPDVIGVDDDQRVEVLLDSVDGKLRAPRALSIGVNGGLSVKLAVGDLDGDGRIDFVDGISAYDLPFPFIAFFSEVCTTGPCTSSLQTPMDGWNSEFTEHDDIVLRDLDGDGDLDFVFTTNRDPVSFVDVWLNSGGGSFGARTDYPVTFVNGLAVGDLTGDNRPELVAVTGGAITVFVNDGAGAFTPRTPFPGGGRIVLGDFNHDGKLDLASTESATAITVRLGNGDGTFAAPLESPTPVALSRLVVADVDGDGNPDLGGDSANAVLIFSGHGDGTFTLAETLPRPLGGLLALADLDRVPPIDLVGTTGALYRAGTTTTVEEWPIAVSQIVDVTGSGHPGVAGLTFWQRATEPFVLASQCR